MQTVLFDAGMPHILDGAHQPRDATLAIAVPGLIARGRVLEASNLGWRNIDPVRQLGLAGPASIVMNDAEAAALGEAALRRMPGFLVYVCIGTGIGGAVVIDDEVVKANLFGHTIDGQGASFGDAICRCERRGCLETVAAGWALPEPLAMRDLELLADALAFAVARERLARNGVVVVGGGVARRYPDLVGLIGERMPGRVVEPTLAPARAKSAAAWGLRYALNRKAERSPSLHG